MAGHHHRVRSISRDPHEGDAGTKRKKNLGQIGVWEGARGEGDDGRLYNVNGASRSTNKPTAARDVHDESRIDRSSLRINLSRGIRGRRKGLWS